MGEQHSRDRHHSGAHDAAKGAIPSFTSASPAQRREQISRTTELKAARATDVARWRSAASHHGSWSERGRLLAGFVKAGERVFEFGAGDSVVAGAIPAGCRYVGSDAAPLRAGIEIFDLNGPVLRSLPGHDVALFSGVLEYVHDFPRLTAYLSQNFPAVICSYAVLRRPTPHEIACRRYAGWFTDLTEPEFVRLFADAGYRLSRRGKWGSQVLFRWESTPRSCNT